MPAKILGGFVMGLIFLVCDTGPGSGQAPQQYAAWLRSKAHCGIPRYEIMLAKYRPLEYQRFLEYQRHLSFQAKPLHAPRPEARLPSLVTGTFIGVGKKPLVLPTPSLKE